MELNEHLEDSPRLKAWYDAVTENLYDLGSRGFPQVVAGWPDEEVGITWGAYIDACKEQAEAYLDTLDEGCDPEPFKFDTYDEWRDERREEEQAGDLGFSGYHCDLCGSLPGHRHKATALPEDPARNNDYVVLETCGDCLQYIANGTLPEDL